MRYVHDLAPSLIAAAPALPKDRRRPASSLRLVRWLKKEDIALVVVGEDDGRKEMCFSVSKNRSILNAKKSAVLCNTSVYKTTIFFAPKRLQVLNTLVFLETEVSWEYFKNSFASKRTLIFYY